MKAFTLVETLVAITIITIAMLGPFQAVQRALTSSFTARDQLIATSLAQEGLEYIRSVRDWNYLYNMANPGSPRSWMYGMNGTGGPNCFANNLCTIDPAQSTPASALGLCSGACQPLNLTTTSLYTQANPSGAVPTRFTRQVQITTISTTEVRVTVSVSWSTNRIPYTVTISDNLQNWL